jgi:hypothetical protein
MLETTHKSTASPAKEKIKWGLVSMLSVVLIMVLYFNFKPSGSGEKTIALQGQLAEALDHSIPALPGKEIMPSLDALIEKEVISSPAVPLLIQDIFSFASRKNGPNSTLMDPPEAEEFVLKGTMIDGDNSVAFLNDEIVALGDTFNGFTMVEITADKAVIRNEEEEITLLFKDELDEKTHK